MKWTTLLLSLVVLVTCVVAPAMAETFEFQVSDGVWDDPLNWLDQQLEQGIPDENDLARILDSQVCRVESGTQKVEFLTVSDGGTLRIEGSDTLEILDSMNIVTGGQLLIEGTGVLELKGSGETSTVNGELLFVKGGTGCTCDPASAPSPGVVKVTVNHTITGSGTIEGGCDDEILDSPCLNPGKLEAVGGAVLTIDDGLVMRNYLDVDVEISAIDDGVKFVVGAHIGEEEYAVDQLMILGEDVTGNALLLVFQGKMQVDGNLTLTGAGLIDMGLGVDPEIEINATGCVESRLLGDSGLLTINADFIVKGQFNLGPGHTGVSPPFDPITVEVAPNVTLSFPNTGGSCP